MRLVCCPACSRHVRDDELACPFCGEAAADVAPHEPVFPPSRYGRVARMAASAGLLVSLTACPMYGGPPEDFPDGGPEIVRDAGTDAGPADAGAPDAGADPDEDAGVEPEDAGADPADAG